MSFLFSLVGGFMFALTVIRARENRPASWYAVGAWAVGSAGLLWSREFLDMYVLLSSASYAGLAFLGLKFGKWLGTKRGG